MTSLHASSEDAEESFLVAFLREATNRLHRCTISEPMGSLEAIRSKILDIQMECLEETVHQHNDEAQKSHDSSSLGQPFTVEHAQDVLRSLPTRTSGSVNPSIFLAVQEMNEAARLAFCRLALYSECLWEASSDSGKCKSCPKHRQSNAKDEPRRPVPLKRAGRMERENVLEFIGLCDVAVRLDEVQRYLSAGNSSASSGRLFPDVPMHESSSSYKLASSILPQDRLEYVQKLLLRVIGYDPAHGHGEIRRIFFDGARHGKSNEYSNDVELVDRFVAMSARMDAALTQATLRATLEAFGGGETNITFVPSTSSVFCSGQVDGGEVLAEEDGSSTLSNQLTKLSIASRATETSKDSPQLSTKLHQEILGELMMMDDDERDALLDEAARAEEELKSIGDGNRGEFRQSSTLDEDEKTHRLLLSGRVWNEMLSQNGGLPPKFQ